MHLKENSLSVELVGTGGNWGQTLNCELYSNAAIGLRTKCLAFITLSKISASNKIAN